jgi:fructan beta-fructosidase
MILNVEKPYIWLPVSKNAPERKLHFYIEGKKIQEIDIHLGKTDCEFYGCWDASAFLGRSAGRRCRQGTSGRNFLLRETL